MATRISIDVDLTIIDVEENLIPGVVEGLALLKEKGYLPTLAGRFIQQRLLSVAGGGVSTGSAGPLARSAFCFPRTAELKTKAENKN